MFGSLATHTYFGQRKGLIADLKVDVSDFGTSWLHAEVSVGFDGLGTA